MIKILCKYYLKFPPIARTAIDFSCKGLMSYSGMDFYQPSPEHILLICDVFLNFKNKQHV